MVAVSHSAVEVSDFTCRCRSSIPVPTLANVHAIRFQSSPVMYDDVTLCFLLAKFVPMSVVICSTGADFLGNFSVCAVQAGKDLKILSTYHSSALDNSCLLSQRFCISQIAHFCHSPRNLRGVVIDAVCSWKTRDCRSGCQAAGGLEPRFAGIDQQC